MTARSAGAPRSQRAEERLAVDAADEALRLGETFERPGRGEARVGLAPVEEASLGLRDEVAADAVGAERDPSRRFVNGE